MEKENTTNKEAILTSRLLNEVGGAVKKGIRFHLNHYTEDANVYNPIIKKLLKEGWMMDYEHCREEEIGDFVFRHVWLIRIF